MGGRAIVGKPLYAAPARPSLPEDDLEAMDAEAHEDAGDEAPGACLVRWRDVRLIASALRSIGRGPDWVVGS